MVGYKQEDLEMPKNPTVFLQALGFAVVTAVAGTGIAAWLNSGPTWVIAASILITLVSVAGYIFREEISPGFFLAIRGILPPWIR